MILLKKIIQLAIVEFENKFKYEKIYTTGQLRIKMILNCIKNYSIVQLVIK